MNLYKISVVIPVYDEKESLSQLFEELRNVLIEMPYDYEIVVVDDGSKDGSWELILNASSSDEKIKAIRLLKNYGQTAAIQVGFENISGDLVLVIDGDGQNDPADIPKLISKIDEGYDVVSGFRSRRKDSLVRRFFSYFGNLLIRKTTGLKIHDVGCSLKIYRKEWIENPKLLGEMHRIFVVYLAEMGAKVAEIKVNHRKRIGGYSKYGLTRVIKLIMDLILYKFFTSFASRPIYVFGGTGFVSISTSFFIFLLVVYRKIVFEGLWLSPLFFIAVTLLTVGILFIMIGILAEIIVRIYYQTKYGFPYKIKERHN
ncbi:MAG: glycosyltransferase family 2 protein [Candidatus Kaelpia aquatica]|nr:glycosyltransferase family 2 protein [Candidatus Kaelpia aquatica]